MAYLTFDTERCTGQLPSGMICHMRETCKRYLALTKHDARDKPWRVPVAMGMKNCDKRIDDDNT